MGAPGSGFWFQRDQYRSHLEPVLAHLETGRVQLVLPRRVGNRLFGVIVKLANNFKLFWKRVRVSGLVKRVSVGGLEKHVKGFSGSFSDTFIFSNRLSDNCEFKHEVAFIDYTNCVCSEVYCRTLGNERNENPN